MSSKFIPIAFFSMNGDSPPPSTSFNSLPTSSTSSNFVQILFKKQVFHFILKILTTTQNPVPLPRIFTLSPPNLFDSYVNTRWVSIVLSEIDTHRCGLVFQIFYILIPLVLLICFLLCIRPNCPSESNTRRNLFLFFFHGPLMEDQTEICHSLISALELQRLFSSERLKWN